jgi:hypothetical protein
MNIIERVKNILITPKTEWEVINAESATPQSLLMGYVLPMAVVASLGAILQAFLFAGTLGLKYFLVMAVIAFAVQVINFYISSMIIDALATSFGSEKNLNKSAQLVAYSATPGYVAGLLSFIPVLGMILGLAAWAYSIYLMYLGIGPLKKTPEDKKVAYMIVSFLVMIILSFVLAAILGMIFLSALGLGTRSLF